MKKTLLSGIAALFLATGTAYADSEKWEASFRQCHIRKWFSKDELAAIVTTKLPSYASGAWLGRRESAGPTEQVRLNVSARLIARGPVVEVQGLGPWEQLQSPAQHRQEQRAHGRGRWSRGC